MRCETKHSIKLFFLRIKKRKWLWSVLLTHLLRKQAQNRLLQNKWIYQTKKSFQQCVIVVGAFGQWYSLLQVFHKNDSASIGERLTGSSLGKPSECCKSPIFCSFSRMAQCGTVSLAMKFMSRSGWERFAAWNSGKPMSVCLDNAKVDRLMLWLLCSYGGWQLEHLRTACLCPYPI